MNRPEPLVPPSPGQRAGRVADAMWATERAMKWLRLDSVGPGRTEMSMSVEAHHVNSNGISHGGFILGLADSAFACNGQNRRSVAAQNAITFVAPGREGDGLRAIAAKVVRAGRSGVCDVTVTKQHGSVVAVMRSNSREVGGAHFEED